MGGREEARKLRNLMAFYLGVGRGGEGRSGAAAARRCVCVGDEHAYASVGPVAEGCEGSRVGGEEKSDGDGGGVTVRASSARVE